MVRCLLVSKITLALHGEGALTIVENAKDDWLTRMGYCTYQDRSTHAMGNLNAYTLSVCLHNYSNHPELPDSSHSEDRLGGLFSYMPTTESITTPHIHTRAVSRRSIN